MCEGVVIGSFDSQFSRAEIDLLPAAPGGLELSHVQTHGKRPLACFSPQIPATVCTVHLLYAATGAALFKVIPPLPLEGFIVWESFYYGFVGNQNNLWAALFA